MVDHGEVQPREPKVLRVRVVVPTAAVAAFSTVTLAGVAALGFASGSLDTEIPNRSSEWAVSTPGGVQVLGTLSDAAGITPQQDAPAGSEDAAAGRDADLEPNAGVGSHVDPTKAQRRPSGAQVSRRQVSRSSSATPSVTPPSNLSSIAHRARTDDQPAHGPAPSSLLQITLPAEVLLDARESVAQELTKGLVRELDAQHAESLRARLKSSAKVDVAVAEATGEAAQQGILAAQTVGGPNAAPSEVSEMAVQTFNAELPKQLTMSVQPVVLNALGTLSSEVSAAALSSALRSAATEAADAVYAEVAPQVGDQVVVLIATTDGSGVAAPTATVSTAPVPVTTSDPTDPTTTSGSTDKNDGPSRSTTTEPTSQPSTNPGTDRGTEPTETSTDAGTDRGTEPTSPTSTESATESSTSRGTGPASEPTNDQGAPASDQSGDPTSPTTVTTSATGSITVTVTPPTAGSDR
jgi:hypothetical protein